MSLAELLPEVKTLSREDKRQLMDALQRDLEDYELLAMFPAGQTIEIWSPYESYETAVILQKALDNIGVYGNALSANQVAALAAAGPSVGAVAPEPSALALLLPGVTMGMLISRRRGVTKR